MKPFDGREHVGDGKVTYGESLCGSAIIHGDWEDTQAFLLEVALEDTEITVKSPSLRPWSVVGSAVVDFVKIFL